MRLKIRTGQCLGWQGFYGLVDGVQSLCSSLPNKKLNNLSLYCACAPAMQTTPLHHNFITVPGVWQMEKRAGFDSVTSVIYNDME